MQHSAERGHYSLRNLHAEPIMLSTLFRRGFDADVPRHHFALSSSFMAEVGCLSTRTDADWQEYRYNKC